MLRVTVELLPFGSEHGRKIIGTMIIANDGTLKGDFGNYRATVGEEYREPKAIEVKEHRRIDGFWPLVIKTLKAAGYVG